MRYAEVNDLRGNLILLTQSEQPIQTLRYSAFGEGLFSNSLSPWRYSGKRVDPETGWVYFGRRYYEPQTGRWTTADPVWFDDGPNLYAYVHNNPLKYFDPDGLSAWDFAKGALKEFGRSAATNLAAGGVLACAGSICPPLAGGMALAYTAYAVGTLTYDNRDLIADISSTFYNEGLYSGLDNISNKIGNEIERFSNLTDNDKGVYATSVATLIVAGRRGIKKNPKANIATNEVKQIWSSTNKQTPVKNAYKHWKKHRKEFTELQNSKQYVEKAFKFLSDPKALTRVKTNGEVIRYNPYSNIFGAYTKDGVPKTLFKPSPSKHKYETNLEYFYGQ